MFVFIGNDPVNVNHIVDCVVGDSLTFINMSNGKRHTVPTDYFKDNILPYLPLAKRVIRKKGDE